MLPSKLKLIVGMFTLFAVACGHRVELKSDDVVEVLKEYKDRGKLGAKYKGLDLEITPEMEPRLFVETTRECSFFGRAFSNCDETILVTTPLEKIAIHKDGLKFKTKEKGLFPSSRELRLSFSEITRLEMQIDHAPENWTPTWALGFVLGGAVQFVGYQLTLFPVDALAVDAGFAVMPQSGVFVGGGFRIRPFRFNNILPFVGVSTAWSDVEAIDWDAIYNKTRFLAGPRLGVDFEFFNRHFLVSLEANLFYDINGEGFIYDDGQEESQGRLKPYGGLSFAYQN